MSNAMAAYPSVKAWGDPEKESFESYYARWPPGLQSIPELVVKDWIYRHWRDFSRYWVPLQPHMWSFTLTAFSNDEIMAIDHVANWIPELDLEGEEYVSGAPRSQARFARYMLSNGTFPLPPIVAKDAGHVVHPRGHGERMKVPLQLIEGHCRLACIRGMIHSNHPQLAKKHDVWLVSIPRE
jgi:hypothetical protein